MLAPWTRSRGKAQGGTHKPQRRQDLFMSGPREGEGGSSRDGGEGEEGEEGYPRKRRMTTGKKERNLKRLWR